MTSGNIAVFDHDALRFADYAAGFNKLFGIDERKTSEVAGRVMEFLSKKQAGQTDSEDILKIKGLVRETEARAAALACGVPSDQLVFMNLDLALSMNLSDDDQTFLMMSYLSAPHYFELHYNSPDDWFRIFKDYNE